MERAMPVVGYRFFRQNIRLSLKAKTFKFSRFSRFEASKGFTLVEVIVSAVVVLVAVVGSIAAFNLVIQSVRGTGIRADQNALIDQDISRINRLSERFTSCVIAQGSLPATGACTGTGVQDGNSFYYFPEIPDADDPSTWTNATNFRSACDSGALRSNFATAIGTAENLGTQGNVTRLAPILNAFPDSNRLIRVTWVDPSRGNRELRSIVISPLVSAWCP